ncbi:MAG: RNA-binding protein [Ahniella sp.]|nr:RNA-binding protein [Ahniella sp.]
MPTRDHDQPSDVRLDLWLWAARFFKTRSLAKAAIVGGKVQIGGQDVKPSRIVQLGDRIDVIRESERYVVTVLALSAVRGPATVAAGLYSESPESQALRLATRERKRFEALGMQPPDGKPDKRARRLLLALGDIEAT